MRRRGSGGRETRARTVIDVLAQKAEITTAHIQHQSLNLTGKKKLLRERQSIHLRSEKDKVNCLKGPRGELAR